MVSTALGGVSVVFPVSVGVSSLPGASVGDGSSTNANFDCNIEVIGDVGGVFCDGIGSGRTYMALRRCKSRS